MQHQQHSQWSQILIVFVKHLPPLEIVLKRTRYFNFEIHHVHDFFIIFPGVAHVNRWSMVEGFIQRLALHHALP